MYYLAQAASETINTNPGTSAVGTVNTGASVLGFSGTSLIVAVIVLAVVFLVIWMVLAGGRGDRTYYRREGLAGTKGGTVKKVTEYEDTDEEILD